MAAEKTPAKANAGDNIEQFGYKQELRRGMGLWDVVMYGVLFMVIIAPQSIFGSIQLNSHGMTPLVYIIGFVAIMFTAMSYMRMSGRFPIAGSVYSYVQRGINPHVGFIAGWLILLDYILVPSLLIVMVMNWVPFLRNLGRMDACPLRHDASCCLWQLDYYSRKMENVKDKITALRLRP